MLQQNGDKQPGKKKKKKILDIAVLSTGSHKEEAEGHGLVAITAAYFGAETKVENVTDSIPYLCMYESVDRTNSAMHLFTKRKKKRKKLKGPLD